MRTSKEQIVEQARLHDFDAVAMEKVARLLELLDTFSGLPLLRDRLVLKGGTALNLFLLDVPRLSVDIDVNLIGASTRQDLEQIRPRIEAGLEAAFASQDLNVRRRPDAHAGGKWSLRYESVFGQGGQLEVDLNTMHRVPLWEPTLVAPRLDAFSLRPTLLQDVHEIVAGKLAALLNRNAGRDLFDTHRLLTALPLDDDKLRLAFVVAGAQATRDWRHLTPETVDAEPNELRARLLPLLRRDHVPDVRSIDSWITNLVTETRVAMSRVLPLTKPEREFIAGVHERGEIQPALITTDDALQRKIQANPPLRWKALNVRRHRGLDTE